MLYKYLGRRNVQEIVPFTMSHLIKGELPSRQARSTVPVKFPADRLGKQKEESRPLTRFFDGVSKYRLVETERVPTKSHIGPLALSIVCIIAVFTYLSALWALMRVKVLPEPIVIGIRMERSPFFRYPQFPIVLLVLLLTPLGLLSQDHPCYKPLVEKGEAYLKQEKYQLAFQYFIAARNCWDIPKGDDLDDRINQVSDDWTQALEAEKRYEEQRKKEEKRLRKVAERSEADALRNDAESSSYVKGYESQKALENNDPDEALILGFYALKRIDDYNRQYPDSSELPIPDFVTEAFGNAVFAEKKKEFHTGQTDVFAFGLAPSADRFYTISRKGAPLKIWTTEGRLLDSLTTAPDDYIHSAFFSDDGQRLLACAKNGTSQLWVGSGQPSTHLNNDATINCGAFLFNNWLLTVDRKGRAQIWNEGGGPELLEDVCDAPLIDIQLNGTKTVALLRSAYRAFVWKLNESGGEITPMPPGQAYIYDSQIAPANNRILLAKANGMVEVLDLQGKVVFKAPHTTAIVSAAFHPYHQEVITGAGDGGIKRVNYGRKDVFSLKSVGHTHAIQKILTSPDGATVLSIGIDSTFHIFGRSDYKGRQGGDITIAAFASSGEKLLLGSSDGFVKLRSHKGNILMSMPLRAEPVGAAFIDSDQQVVAVNRRGMVFISPVPEGVYWQMNQ